jgi:ribosome-associated heat shock protein Hsp15
MAEAPDSGRVRLDKWLWAARFFKTRTLAADAIAGGKVDVNGDRAKRARPLQIGGGKAADAAQLYDETEASRVAREALAAQLRALPDTRFETGRPTKKDRRALDRFRPR